MENKSLLNLIDKFQEVLLYSIPVCAILFFLPLIFEFFEFNKQTFLIIAGSLGFVVWAIKTVLVKKLSIVKSPLDFGIGLLFISAIFSTGFSINKFSSLLGQYGRVFPNIFIAVTLFALYYTLLSNLKEVKVIENTIKIAVWSGGLAALFTLLSVFGVVSRLFTVYWLQVNFFSTAGSSITLGIICGALFAAGLALSLRYANSKNTPLSIFYLSPTLLMGLYVVYINAIPVWISFGAATLVIGFNLYFYNLSLIKRSNLTKFLITALFSAMVTFGAMLYMPSLNKMLNLRPEKPKEVALNIQTSWQISAGTLKDYPLAGTGLSTYLTDFTVYKPMSFNNNPFWNYRFFKPGNEFFRILSEQGLLGVLAFFILIISIIKITLRSKLEEANLIRIGLSSGVLGLSLSLFAYTANTALTVLLLVLLVLLVGIEKELGKEGTEELILSLSAIRQKFLSLSGESDKKEPKKELLTYIFLAVSIIIAIPLIFAAERSFVGSLYHKKALESLARGNLAESYNYYIAAIGQNPFSDSYRREYSDLNIIILANMLPQDNETKLSEKDKADIQQIANQATREIQIATDRLNPLNVLNWEQRARLYNQLAVLDPNANQFALEATQRALQLDPLNPVLRVGSRDVVGLGGLYFANKDYQSAAITFAEAIQLKRDFANAYFNLSLSQAQLKSWDAAISNMEIVLRLIPQDSPDYKVAKDSLDALEKAKIEAANAETETSANQPAPMPEPVPQPALETETPVAPAAPEEQNPAVIEKPKAE